MSWNGNKGMRYSAAIIAVLLSVGMLPAPASSAAKSHHRSHSQPQHTVTTAAAAGADCMYSSGLSADSGWVHAGAGTTWSGLPTGYDVVVCPPGGSPPR
jgi:hypothetical protein